MNTLREASGYCRSPNENAERFFGEAMAAGLSTQQRDQGHLADLRSLDSPSFYPGSRRKTAALATGVTFHCGYFFPLAWSTAPFSFESSISDKEPS
jgi:hypothetical protein